MGLSKRRQVGAIGFGSLRDLRVTRAVAAKNGLGRGSLRRYRIGMEKPLSHEPNAFRGRPLQVVWLLSGLVCLAAYAALAIDVSLSRLVQTDGLPGDLRRVLGLAEVFAHGVGVALIVWCLWHVAPSYRWRLPRLAACAAAPGIAANVLKLVFARMRPTFYAEQWPGSFAETWAGVLFSAGHVRAEVGTYFASSFPSGHAATAFGLAIGLSWLFPAGRIPFFAVAALAATQRVTSGAHWLSDVLAGVTLAALLAGWLTSDHRCAQAWGRWEDRRILGVRRTAESDARRAA
jgi:membrane-associated phospholipid phosphatase